MKIVLLFMTTNNNVFLIVIIFVQFKKKLDHFNNRLIAKCIAQ